MSLGACSKASTFQFLCTREVVFLLVVGRACGWLVVVEIEEVPVQVLYSELP
jgi:hypothetical protein